MIDQLVNGIGSMCIILLAGMGMVALHRINNRQVRNYENSIEFYLFKISRLTGHSAYDVFCKSAEEWPVAAVPREKIDADYKNYMNHTAIPPYVHHFVRQNKQHINELQLPNY